MSNKSKLLVLALFVLAVAALWKFGGFDFSKDWGGALPGDMFESPKPEPTGF